MANMLSNHYKFALHSGNIDFDADIFKIALVGTGFLFDPDVHANWSDVSASELTGGNGYTAGGATLAGVAISEDDVNNRSDVTFNDQQWTASGGSIGPTCGAIIFKDSGVAVTSVVVGYIDFGSDKTVTDGLPLSVNNIIVRGA